MRLRLFGFGCLALVTMASAAPLVSCGSGGAGSEQAPTIETSGSIGLSLTPVPGLTLAAVTYVITGPGNVTRNGSVDVRNSKTFSTTVGGIPTGVGYAVTLSAISVDGNSSCNGVAGFDVAAGSTTKVVVKLQCRSGPKTGGVMLNGAINVCPVIDGVDVSPAETMVGASMQLTASANDADYAPAALGYHWSASSGSLASPSSADATFTCLEPGPAAISLEISDGDCSEVVTTTVTCSAESVDRVAASVETTPVPDTGDAADDPAVWVHPTNPELSVVLGTDKQAGGGLGVYGLDGQQLQYLPWGKLNNVDLRDGFPLGGTHVTLVTAGNRSDNSIAIFTLDPTTRQLTEASARTITTLATYGSCMYKSPTSGKYYYFVDAKDGSIEQWELFDNAGKVDAVKVRDLHRLSSQPEACAVDDEAQALFVGEEATGVWKFDAEPNVTSGPGFVGVLIASTEPGGHLARDVEGVAIAKTSATSGFIFVSNQGQNSYSVFTREAPHNYVKTFEVARGAACVDQVTGSDGIEVNAANLGPAFPHGVFVTQDDSNDGSNQNFKLVRLDHILGAPTGVDDSGCDGGGGGGAGGSGAGGSSGAAGASGAGGSGGAAAGYGEPFCTTFCDKCASCYATGSFSEGDCVYQLPKTAFTIGDCKAGCAVSATPGVAAKAALSDGFESMTCAAFDDTM